MRGCERTAEVSSDLSGACLDRWQCVEPGSPVGAVHKRAQACRNSGIVIRSDLGCECAGHIAQEVVGPRRGAEVQQRPGSLKIWHVRDAGEETLLRLPLGGGYVLIRTARMQDSCARVRPTRRRSTSPTTRARARPLGLRRATIRPARMAGRTGAGTSARASRLAAPCSPLPRLAGCADARWLCLTAQQLCLVWRFASK